jgi:hypothetical protein
MRPMGNMGLKQVKVASLCDNIALVYKFIYTSLSEHVKILKIYVQSLLYH